MAAEPRSLEVDGWIELLRPHSPDVGIGDTFPREGTAFVTVTVTVDAESLGAAASRAVVLVEQVTGGPVIGVMTFDTHEYELHVEAPFRCRRRSHSLIGYSDIADISGA